MYIKLIFNMHVTETYFALNVVKTVLNSFYHNSFMIFSNRLVIRPTEFNIISCYFFLND